MAARPLSVCHPGRFRQAFIAPSPYGPTVLRPKFQEGHVDVILSFLRHHLKESGRKGCVLGTSGGIDSTLVARLCADAVGPARVLGLAMPERATGGPDERDARDWAKRLGIGFRTIEIGPLVEAVAGPLKIPAKDRVGRGNVKARIRMITLYQVAHAEDRLVIGTSNKSEYCTGYWTKFGDGACDFAPIGDLYKTQVREMARHLGLPAKILRKVPTAGLWPGQTDEGDLGISYEELDRVLFGIELRYTAEEIAERAGVDVKRVRRIEGLVAASVHKRKMPLIPKIGVRTFGLDWRE
jgi:NAD+ synthase